MQLKYPIIITPSLLPGMQVGGAWLSISYARRPGAGGRTRYRWELVLPDGTEYSDDDLQSGCQGGDLRGGLVSLLSFLSACGESYRYKMARPDSEPENLDLFPPAVAEWAYQSSGEIDVAQLEVEETEDCIIE